jgi:hypothetical protein
VGLRVADPHHFVADLDTAFHFHSDPDPTFCFNAVTDPDPAHHRDANLRLLSWSKDHPELYSILSLHAFIVSVINAVSDPDPTFHCHADPDPASKIMPIHANPDPQQLI